MIKILITILSVHLYISAIVGFIVMSLQLLKYETLKRNYKYIFSGINPDMPIRKPPVDGVLMTLFSCLIPGTNIKYLMVYIILCFSDLNGPTQEVLYTMKNNITKNYINKKNKLQTRKTNRENNNG